MSALPSLESIVNETKQAFVSAKADGKLEAAEVVQIATGVAKKIHALQTVSADEKKALVLLALKKGLAEAGGLLGLKNLSIAGPDALAAVEKQVLNAALAAVYGLMDAAPHLFAPAHNLLSRLRGFLSVLLPYCSQAAALASVLDPKDAKLIEEAKAYLEGLAAAPAASEPVASVPAVSEPAAAPPSLLVSSPESVAPLEKKSEDTPEKNIAETEPSPAASLPGAPESTPQDEPPKVVE
jgi:hypothetical protein